MARNAILTDFETWLKPILPENSRTTTPDNLRLLNGEDGQMQPADRKVLPKANAIRTTTKDIAPIHNVACFIPKQDKVWPSKVNGKARKAQKARARTKAKARTRREKAAELLEHLPGISEGCHLQAIRMLHLAENGSLKVTALHSKIQALANTPTHHNVIGGLKQVPDVLSTRLARMLVLLSLAGREWILVLFV